jgi:signal transduction histidine kinase
MRLLPFESCIGTPITANLPARMALFVFHSRRSAFAGSHRELVAAAAYAITSVLERQLFLEQASDLQRLALLGQLSRALVHEVNHRLSPVDFALDTLQAEFRDLERMIAKLPQADAHEYHTERAFLQVSQSLNSLAQAIRALIQTARLFGKMARTEHEAGTLVLSEAAIEVADLLRDSAHKQHVKIHVDLPDRLAATRTQITLVRQVLINVVLNAIQQIELYRPREGGQVRIAVGERWEDDRRLVYFRVEDDGPGIHRRMWGQIFQLGYTTRKDGSGLGLHISRSLMESLGGRIEVLDSYLYWGTVFVIELPLRT